MACTFAPAKGRSDESGADRGEVLSALTSPCEDGCHRFVRFIWLAL